MSFSSKYSVQKSLSFKFKSMKACRHFYSFERHVNVNFIHLNRLPEIPNFPELRLTNQAEWDR